MLIEALVAHQEWLSRTEEITPLVVVGSRNRASYRPLLQVPTRPVSSMLEVAERGAYEACHIGGGRSRRSSHSFWLATGPARGTNDGLADRELETIFAELPEAYKASMLDKACTR